MRCVAAVLFSLLSAQILAMAGQAPALVLHFPHTIETANLMIHYARYGNGMEGSFVSPQPRVWDYVIPDKNPIRPPSEPLAGGVRWVEIGPARAVKVDIVAPGYSVVLIDIPSLADLQSRDVTIDLKPLPQVTITGRVASPDDRWPDSAVVGIGYAADWECQFYGALDCFEGIKPIAQSMPLAADGVFSVRVPDFAHDPGLAGFSRGTFYFTIRDSRTGKVWYRLAPHFGVDPARAGFGIDVFEASRPDLMLYTYPPG